MPSQQQLAQQLFRLLPPAWGQRLEAVSQPLRVRCLLYGFWHSRR